MSRVRWKLMKWAGVAASLTLFIVVLMLLKQWNWGPDWLRIGGGLLALWGLLALASRYMERKDARENFVHEIEVDGRVELRWPNLPAGKDIVMGRLATREDVEAGRAAFVMSDYSDKPASPARIDLPQYGAWRGAPGEHTAVIVFQAETDGELTMLGFWDVEGGSLDAEPLSKFELFGRTPPVAL